MSHLAIRTLIDLGVQNEAEKNLIEFCQENLVTANTLFQQQKRRLYTWTSPGSQYQNQIDDIFAAKDGESQYSQQKQVWELTVARIMSSFMSQIQTEIEESGENH